VVTTKELLVRPVTPRFLVINDHAQLAAVVQNNTAEPLQVEVSLQANGFVLDDPGSNTQQVSVPAQGRARVEWWGTAQAVPSVDLVFSAQGGGYQDAAHPPMGALPVLRFQAPQTFRTSGTMETAGEINELISLPRSFDAQGGQLDVELSPSLAAAMIRALDVLETYPFQSTEQILSSFLPNLETYRTLQDYGIEDPGLKARLDRTLNEGLQRLKARQNFDGGWSWWQEPESDPYITAYVLYGLFQARNAIRAAERVVVVEGYMDVVALAQHGVDYVVATLGTATTPAHIQKLFRLTGNVVFCFDGDAAGRKAAWRALEDALPALADGRHVAFLFLPEGLDPDDYVRERGKAAFEASIAGATPLSELMLAELSARSPHETEEGRAALVAAARPLFAQLHAPALAALVRRRLSERVGLPEAELRDLLGPEAPRTTPDSNTQPAGRGMRVAARPAAHGSLPQRPAPSLVRELIQALLLQPELARSVALPTPTDRTPEDAALAALVAFCSAGEQPLTTAGVIQHFAGTAFEPMLARALATAEDHAITGAHAADHLRAGVARYWQRAQRAGQSTPEAGSPSTEEAERLRQLEMVRRSQQTKAPGALGGHS
jgi:hypothetical protein